LTCNSQSGLLLLLLLLLQGYGVYKFADKYGANVDGYSPIYTPDLWTEGGDSYKLGTKGLIAWWVVFWFVYLESRIVRPAIQLIVFG
jgi:hypothetical protein